MNMVRSFNSSIGNSNSLYFCSHIIIICYFKTITVTLNTDPTSRPMPSAAKHTSKQIMLNSENRKNSYGSPDIKYTNVV